MKLTSGALTMMIAKYRAVLEKMFANNNLALRKSIAALSAGVIMTAAAPGMAATYTVGAGGSYATLSALVSAVTLNEGDVVVINGDDSSLRTPFKKVGDITITGQGTLSQSTYYGTSLIENINTGKTVYIYNENGRNLIIDGMMLGGAVSSFNNANTKVSIGKAGQDGWTIFRFNKENTNSLNGGAIGIGSAGVVELAGNVRFSYNESVLNASQGLGGAIYVSSIKCDDPNANIEFEGNTASRGGALFISQNGPSSSLNGNFIFNNNYGDYSGGAIYLSDNTRLTLNGHTEFTDNISGFFDYASGDGGAIYLANNAALTLKGYTEFINNTSIFYTGSVGGRGGAIYGTAGSTVTLGGGSETLFFGNSNRNNNNQIIRKSSSAVTVANFVMEPGSILCGEGGFAAETFSLQNATIAPENGTVTLSRINVSSGNVQKDAVTTFDNMTVQGQNGNLVVDGSLNVLNNLTVDGAKLNVNRNYTQNSANTHLTLTANADGTAVINVAGTATLKGTYELKGANLDSPDANKASQLTRGYILIHAEGGITDNGFTYTGAAVANPVDYVLFSSGLENGNKDFTVKQALTWNNADGQAKGDFTIDAGKSFEVDLALANNTAPGANWDGKSLTKKGEGTLILSAVNTYTGATKVDGGTLTLKAVDAVKTSGDVIVGSGSRIVFGGYNQTLNNLAGNGSIDLGVNVLTANNTKGTTFGGVIGGAGGLNKTGAGALTLSGVNTYTGSSTINAGSLVLNAADAIKTSREVIVNGGGIVFGNNQILNNLSGAGGSLNLGAYALTANNNADTIFGSVISGAGGLVKTGANTLALSGVNTYTGTTTVNAGTLTLDAKDTIAQSGQVTVNSGGQLVLGNDQTLNKLSGDGKINLTDKKLTTTNNNYSATVFGGVISGAGSLVKNGTGTLTLAGDNTYTGGTVINDGGLQIGDGTSGSVKGNIENNASLYFNNNTDSSYAGVLSGDEGSMLKNGTGKLTLTGAGSRQYGVNVAEGTLAIGAAGAAVNFSTVGGYGTNDGATTQIGAGSALNVGGKFIQEKNSHLILTANTDGSAVITAAGDVSLAGTYEVSGIGGGNVSAKASQLDNKYVLIETTGGKITDNGFTNSGGVMATGLDYLLRSGGVNANKYEIAFSLAWNAANENATGNFTMAQGTSFEIDAGFGLKDKAANQAKGWDGKSLNKEGAGNLILSTTNTYTGATTVNDGTLTLKAANAIATSNEVIVNNGGKIVFDGSGQTLKNLSGSGSIDLKTNELTANNTKDTKFAGAIGGAGGLIKTGANALTLTGVNTYTGATTVEAGSLRLGAANAIERSGEVVVNGGQIVLDGYGQILNNLSGAGGSVNLSGNTLTANNTKDTTFGGVIGGGGLARSGDTGSLIKTGAGTLTLNGVSTYTGTTSVNAGILKLGAANALASSGEVIINSGGQIVLDGSNQTLNNLSGSGSIALGSELTANNTKDTAFGGEINGAGSLVKDGAGMLTLTGNTYDVGETTVAGGALKIGDTGKKVNFNANGNYTVQTGAATEIGAGSTLNVDGNFIQGANSNLILTSDSQNAVINITGTATLNGEYVVNDTEAVKASGLGQQEYLLIHAGEGITNNGHISSYSDYVLLDSEFLNGDTDYKVKTSLAWNDKDGNATGDFTLNAGKSFEVDQVLGGNNSPGAGWDGKSLTKKGEGELILSEKNTYSGTTGIQAGTLTLSAANAIETSSQVIVDGTVNLYRGEGSYNQTFNKLSGGGRIDLGEAVLTVNNAAIDGNSEFGGTITGNGSLVKTGEGVLTLSGASEYTGGTAINTGGIVATNGNALGGSKTEINNAAFLEFSIGKDGTETFRGDIDGAAGSFLIKSGEGQLTLNGTAINHLGTTRIGNGSLVIASDGARLGSVENASILSFGRNYDNPNQGYSLTIGRYSGDGLVSLNAYVTENKDDSWTDFLTFTENPDNVVNLGFNFVDGSDLKYMPQDGLRFAKIGQGENVEGGDTESGGNVFKLQTVSSAGLIGASELFISTEDNSNYYLQKRTNVSAIKAYSEALGASASQLAAMFDTPLFSGLQQAGFAAKGGDTGIYLSGGRMDYRHKTGSHADIKGNSFALALAWEKKKIKYGVFGQTFNGNYKTTSDAQTQAGAVTINSNGTLKSHDLGIFATYTPGRQAGSDGVETGAYYTTVLKTGRSSNNFDGGSDLGGSTFESGKGTFGYSLGGGYVKELKPGRTVDYYGHIVYSHLDSDELTDSVGQRIGMDAVNSIRLLSGVQWTLNANKSVSTIIRTGLDYEFRGESTAYIDSVKAASANVKGLTGVIELGFSAKKGNKLTIDGMIHGFVGKKSGLAGSLMLKTKF